MVSMRSFFMPFAFVTIMNHVYLGMIMAHQLKYPLRMNIAHK
jgi:hypothetical protein